MPAWQHCQDIAWVFGRRGCGWWICLRVCRWALWLCGCAAAASKCEHRSASPHLPLSVTSLGRKLTARAPRQASTRSSSIHQPIGITFSSLQSLHVMRANTPRFRTGRCRRIRRIIFSFSSSVLLPFILFFLLSSLVSSRPRPPQPTTSKHIILQPCRFLFLVLVPPTALSRRAGTQGAHRTHRRPRGRSRHRHQSEKTPQARASF